MRSRLLLFLGILFSYAANAQFEGAALMDSLFTSAAAITGPSEVILVNQDSTVYKENFGEERLPESISASSASKWLVAATLLTLVDDGLISLDKGIGNYIRQFRGDKGEITLRQLLSHTSGLAANSVFILDPDLSLERSVKKIARKASLLTPPGTQFVYGDVSYQIAGYLAEEVTGKDWETIFKARITRPCLMPHTNFGYSDHVNISEGAYSTAEDFANFLMMIMNKGMFNGVRVLSEQSISEMLTDHISDLKIGYTPYYFKSAMLSDYYGLGIWINRIMLTDSSATEVSARGANGFIPWINLCGNIGGIYAFNSDINLVEPYIRKAATIIDASFEDCLDVQPEERQFFKESNENREITNVLIKLEEDAMVSLKLFDVLGNEILVLINGKTRKGTYLVPIETTYLARGIYFYRLVIDDRVETKKLRLRK